MQVAATRSIYAVGFKFEKRFIAYTTAFDKREARALLKAIHAVMDLFNATSGAWVTMCGTTEIPRGATKKAKARKKRKKSKG
ncbi:MAG TPA: hypothetical protein VFE47_16490 [Tepidisphaeraceae bacterium]|jgi:hypothetical protein|nr:hypothetical protein [Tepidisphaeraceae bacterium]